LALLRCIARVLHHAASACLHYRVSGLAAEVAFWALVALPPLVFGLTGAIGFIANSFPIAEIDELRRQMFRYAGQFLTPDTVDDLIAPTVDEVLGSARLEVVSIGFLIALWSGSRATAVFVDAVTIMYGLHGYRGIIRTRVLSFAVYVAFLVGTAITLPLVLAGPDLTRRLLPEFLDWLGVFYWPVVLVATTALLVTVLHWATPIRNFWRAHLPGAVLTMAVWLIGSTALRWALITLTGGASIFGPLAAPIALLAWLYLIALAVLIGAAVNAAVAKVLPGFAGITAREAERVLEANDADEDVEEDGENLRN
jgi:membrane protein